VEPITTSLRGIFNIYGLDLLAVLASIVGCGVSLYVLREVTGIKKKYLFRIRVPEIIKSITSYTSDLSEKLEHFEENRKVISVIFVRCNSTLEILESKLKGNSKRHLQDIKENLKNKNSFNYDEAWVIYGQLLGLLDYLKESKKDLQWSD
jgi:hypothetical protein